IIALLAELPEASPPPTADSNRPSPDALHSDGPESGGNAPSPQPDGGSPAAKARSRSPKKEKRKSNRGGNPLPQDIRTPLARAMGVDLTRIPGLNMVAVL